MPEDRRNLADFFLDYWSEIHETLPEPDALTGRVDEIRTLAQRLIGPDDSFLHEQVDSVSAAELGPIGILVALDRLLGSFHPAFGARHQASSLASRWHERGVMAERASGVLLARWPSELATSASPAVGAGPTAQITDLFSSVLPVSAEVWTKFTVVPPCDLPMPISGGFTRKLLMACLPLFDDIGQFGLSWTDDGVARWYGPDPDATHTLALMPRAVAALRGSGCDIAMMPELVLREDLIGAWGAMLRAQGGPDLRVVLLGTGLTPGGRLRRTNDAVVVNVDTGLPVGRYSKRFPFMVTGGTIGHWGIDPELPQAGAPYREDISPGNRPIILETIAGRFTIVICEDLKRMAAIGQDLLAVDPTVLLAPVFGLELTAEGWQGWAQTAAQAALEVAASVVVGNSMAVPRRMETNGRRVANAEVITSVMVPSRRSDGSRSGRPDLGKTSDPLSPTMHSVVSTTRPL